MSPFSLVQARGAWLTVPTVGRTCPRLILESKDIEPEKAVVFTGYNNGLVTQQSSEALNRAVLDCVRASTLCDENWIRCYVESLHDDETEGQV